MDKEIKLTLHSSIYDAVKEEVRKEYKRWHFTNLIMPILFIICFCVIFSLDKPSNWSTWEKQCDYMITTEIWTEYIKTNSNMSVLELQWIVWDRAVIAIRELSCDWERE